MELFTPLLVRFRDTGPGNPRSYVAKSRYHTLSIEKCGEENKACQTVILSSRRGVLAGFTYVSFS